MSLSMLMRMFGAGIRVDRYPMMSHILKVRRKRTLVDLLPLMSTAPMLALFMEQSGVL